MRGELRSAAFVVGFSPSHPLDVADLVLCNNWAGLESGLPHRAYHPSFITCTCEVHAFDHELPFAFHPTAKFTTLCKSLVEGGEGRAYGKYLLMYTASNVSAAHILHVESTHLSGYNFPPGAILASSAVARPE